MSMMVHHVRWLHPVQQTDQGGFQYFDQKNYTDNGCLYVNVQPATSAEAQFHEARGTEITHTVYATTNPGIKRNDVLLFRGRRLVVMGEPFDLIERNRVWQIPAKEWPDVAKERG